MKQQQANGKQKFLIDGFPRNLDNKSGWEKATDATTTYHSHVL